MQSDFYIKALDSGDTAWRINWFGEIAYPGEVKRYRQPCVRVMLSPLDSTESRATDGAKSIGKWFPIGALPLLCAGDIWESGVLQKHSVNGLETFQNLTIDSSSTKFVKAGVDVDGSFLLPFSHHPWHQQNTNSYCVVVRVSGEQQLIIPCMEIIRFYFGSSSSLLHTLFTGPFAEDKLWRDKHYNPVTGHLHIKLAGYLPGSSAADIGRVAMSSYAKRSAAAIYTSSLRAIHNKHPIYPCANFPFEGKTTLKASGMWLPSGNQEKANFLVFSIKSCSHRFPFESLTYEVSEKLAAKRKDSTSSQGNARGSAHSSNRTILDEKDPGAIKEPKRFVSDTKVKFPDLSRKSVWMTKTVTQSGCQVFMKREDGGFEQVSFGTPEGSGKARSVDACSEADAITSPVSLDDLPWFVRTGIDAYRQESRLQPTAQFTAYVLHGFNAPVFSLPMLVDANGEIDQSTIFLQPDSTHRPRQACVFKVSDYGQEIEKIVVIEGQSLTERPLAISIRTTMTENLLHTIFRKLASM